MTSRDKVHRFLTDQDYEFNGREWTDGTKALSVGFINELVRVLDAPEQKRPLVVGRCLRCNTLGIVEEICQTCGDEYLA